MTDKLSFTEIGQMHEEIERVTEELTILTAKHTCLFAYIIDGDKGDDATDKLMEIDSAIRQRLERLYAITKEEIYKVQ